jgi:hypothetical protein
MDSGLIDTYVRSLHQAILQLSLIYILSSIIGLIVLFLIVRAAVQSGTMAALLDAGLVKRNSPYAQRIREAEAEEVEAAGASRSAAADSALTDEEPFFIED